MAKECKKCGSELVLLSEIRELVEPDFENMTDGQMSDWFAEEASGEYTNYGIDLLTYNCRECDEIEYWVE